MHSGTALFTLIGFTGLYFVLGVLFLFLSGARSPTDRTRSRPTACDGRACPAEAPHG